MPHTLRSLEDVRSDWRERFWRAPALRSAEILDLMLSWRVQAAEEGGLAGPTRAALLTAMRLVFEVAILSLIRSPATSRSNWANESSTFSVSRPMLVVVLNACVTAPVSC